MTDMIIWHKSLTLVGAGLLTGVAAIAAAQEKPPIIPGHTGTLALEGTVDDEYKGAHAILVKTADGIRHLVHFTGHTTVHGLKDADPLRGLEVGTSVVVHFVKAGEEVAAVEVDRVGADGLQVSEGLVTRVDRLAKTLVLRLPDGTTDTLRLTDRAAADVGKQVHRADRVIVYYADEEGHRVAHFFKRATK
jgi:hypothetical protein